MNESEIRDKILNEIEKTEKQIADYKEMNKPVSPDVAIGRISRMDAINNKSITAASLQQAEHKLKSLNHVLNNLGSKDFGICVKCKQAIPLARILIRPESLYCVNCAK
ncbi:MAG: TraR/DksA C4-type zinc finger protein [Bacteroidota bacterium]